MNIEWSPLAIERVAEISEYISQDSPMAAAKWVESIFEKSAILGEFPESGRVVPELKKHDIRELLFGNYRIIYKVGSNVISVLTVRHTRQILPVEEVKA